MLSTDLCLAGGLNRLSIMTPWYHKDCTTLPIIQWVSDHAANWLKTMVYHAHVTVSLAPFVNTVGQTYENSWQKHIDETKVSYPRLQHKLHCPDTGYHDRVTNNLWEQIYHLEIHCHSSKHVCFRMVSVRITAVVACDIRLSKILKLIYIMQSNRNYLKSDNINDMPHYLKPHIRHAMSMSKAYLTQKPLWSSHVTGNQLKTPYCQLETHLNAINQLYK